MCRFRVIDAIFDVSIYHFSLHVKFISVIVSNSERFSGSCFIVLTLLYLSYLRTSDDHFNIRLKDYSIINIYSNHGGLYIDILTIITLYYIASDNG